MSQVYNLEPPTRGQVVLHTSHGDVEIELWPKEAPKESDEEIGQRHHVTVLKRMQAVRNFTQLCMEGYYDNTIFHRVIKDFMIQGGDPTGTGSGGESIYGRQFKSEFHSRLKFNHRGLVACATEADKADSNGSQFFITTERCDHLDRQNTIFGRVSGDTIFTVLRMQEVEVDDLDRPVDPPSITSCEVLLPPFDDIIPRTTPEERRAKAATAAEVRRLADVHERKQHGKRLNVLSFGDDAEEDELEEPDAAAVRFRSAHETLPEDAMLEQVAVGVHDEHIEQLQQRLADEKEAQAERDAAVIAAEAEATTRRGHRADDADVFATLMRAKVQSKSGGKGSSVSASVHHTDQNRGSDEVGRRLVYVGHDAKLRQTSAEGAAAQVTEHKVSTFISDHQKSVAKYKRQKRSREERQADTLSQLKAFKTRLKDARSSVGIEEKTPQVALARASGNPAYDGKVNKNIDHRSYMPASWRIDSYLDESDGDDGENLTALATHRMVWDGDDGVADPTTRRESVDDYKVLDPLIEAGKAAFNLKAQKAKKRGTEWAGRANI